MKKNKKNKKGFTLIELLAVILILGIIALIAIPTVNNVIEESKEGAAESSAKEYLKLVEQQVTMKQMNDEETQNGTYSTTSFNEEDLGVKGTVPDGGLVNIEGNTVTNGTLFIDGYSVLYKDDTYSVVKGKIFQNGTPIYFNPNTGKLCSSNESVSETGTNNGCMIWYVYNDSEDASTVNLLLDHNSVMSAVWNESGSNVNGPSETFLNTLKENTKDWEGVPERTDSYSLDNGIAKYTIDYTGYRARLITMEEVAEITGNKDFDINTTYDIYFYENLSSTQPETYEGTYAWLYENLREVKQYGAKNEQYQRGCLHGYWTASAVATVTDRAWTLYSEGSTRRYVPSAPTQHGIRPVITIDRSILLN